MAWRVLSIFVTLMELNKVNGVLTDCSASEDACLCLWDMTITTRIINNGIYRKYTNPPWPSPTPPKATDKGKADELARHWINDDFTEPVPSSTATNAAYTYGGEFYWYDGNSRWRVTATNLVGDCNGGCDDICFCDNGAFDSNDFVPDNPTTIDCGTGNWKCFGGIGDANLYIDVGTVTYGRCPELTDTCSSLRVEADAPFELCNGIYDAVDPSSDFPFTLDLLDNEFNIYRNRDDNRVNRYLYFDHTQWRWVCAIEYRPNQINYATAYDAQYDNGYTGFTMLYRGADKDPGDPSWFSLLQLPFGSSNPTSEQWRISVNSGGSFIVKDWKNGTAPQGTGSDAIFTCNPVGPTPEPTTATPTSATTSPTQTSDSPTIATNSPSEATNSPTDASASPTGATPGPTIITDAPTDATPAPIDPSPEPTKPPTEFGQTPEPTDTTNSPTQSTNSPTQNTNSPTQVTPSPTDSTDSPTSDTASPTDATSSPSRSPLPNGQTHVPITARPTDVTSAPTLPTTAQPTDATDAPTNRPTTAQPSIDPTQYQRATPSPEDAGIAVQFHPINIMIISLLLIVYGLF